MTDTRSGERLLELIPLVASVVLQSKRGMPPHFEMPGGFVSTRASESAP